MFKIGDRVRFEDVDALTAEGVIYEDFYSSSYVSVTKVFKYMNGASFPVALPYIWMVPNDKLKKINVTYKQFISERFVNG